MNNNVYFLEKSSAGLQQINLKTKLYSRRVILIDKEINNTTVNDVVTQFINLELESNDPITVLINSPGGVIEYGKILVDLFLSSKCEIRTIAIGLSASFAAVLTACGHKRYILKSSRLMLHEPLLMGGGVRGSCTQINETAKQITKVKREIIELLCQVTNKDSKTISKLVGKDTFLSAEESISFGLVDEAIDGHTLIEIIGGNK